MNCNSAMCSGVARGPSPRLLPLGAMAANLGSVSGHPELIKEGSRIQLLILIVSARNDSPVLGRSVFALRPGKTKPNSARPASSVGLALFHHLARLPQVLFRCSCLPR